MNPYRYFSLIFSYPTEESLREIAELSESAGAWGLRSGEALAAIPLEEAQAEYTRLFISSHPSLLCPPYESYYREGTVYGSTAVEVGEWYERGGLRFTCQGEPPDLLSAELDYLAITNDSQFLTRMREWVFEFAQRVETHSELYGQCARELAALLSGEQPSGDLIYPEARLK